MTYVKIILLAACFELMCCIGLTEKVEAPAKPSLNEQDLSEVPATGKTTIEKTASGYFPIHILIR